MKCGTGSTSGVLASGCASGPVPSATFELPEEVPWDQAKKLLIARLGEEDHIESEDVGDDPLLSVIGPIIDAVADYAGKLRSVGH